MANKLKYLFITLRPLGYLYSWIMRVRSFLYTTGYIQSNKFSIPVISVGNLTMGGSGKTPVVIHLAKFFLNKGVKTAIISRGYKGKTRKPINVVADGNNLLLSCIEAGDEPRMIAEMTPGSIVLTGKKRVIPCRYAENVYKSELVILDDGFQHLAVQRDLDIVLFNGSELYNNFHVIPGGILRESFAALQRATCVCITGCNKENERAIKNFSSFLQKYEGLPVFHLESEPCCFADSKGKIYDLDVINVPVLAFCGIASPDRFKKSLTDLSIQITDFIPYADHTKYTQDILHQLEELAENRGAKLLITTQKDMVKLREMNCRMPLLALSIQVKTNPEFDAFVAKRVQRYHRHGNVA